MRQDGLEQHAHIPDGFVCSTVFRPRVQKRSKGTAEEAGGEDSHPPTSPPLPPQEPICLPFSGRRLVQSRGMDKLMHWAGWALWAFELLVGCTDTRMQTIHPSMPLLVLAQREAPFAVLKKASKQARKPTKPKLPLIGHPWRAIAGLCSLPKRPPPPLGCPFRRFPQHRSTPPSFDPSILDPSRPVKPVHLPSPSPALIHAQAMPKPTPSAQSCQSPRISALVPWGAPFSPYSFSSSLVGPCKTLEWAHQASKE